MKPKGLAKTLLGTSALTAAIVLTLTANRTQAATISWDGDTSTDWATGANWTGDVAPTNDLLTDIALFNLATYTNQPNAGTTSVAGIQIGDGATSTGTLTVSGTSLTLGSSGISMLANAGAATISAPIVLGSSQTWTNNSSNLLTLGSTVTSAATGTQTLTVGGSGNTRISGLLNDGTSGTLNLTKSGAGYLTLAGAATNINGALDIQGGTVGVVNDFTATGLTGTGTLENASNNDKWTFWNIAGNQTFDGVIRNNNGTNTGLLGINKNGTGTLTLTNNASNATSVLNVNAGKLILNNTGTFGATLQGGGVRLETVFVGNTAGVNGVLEVNGATLNYNNRSSGGDATFRSTLSIGNNGTGAGALKLNSGSLTTLRQLGIGTVNGAFGAYSQTGGTATVGGFLAIGLGTGNGVFNQSGGTFTLSSAPVTNGGGTGSKGVMNLSGTAQFNMNAAGDNGLWVGESGAGVLNVSGSAAVTLASGNNGVQLGRNAAGSGIVNLLGGTLTTKAVTKGAGTGTFNFNGGTLTANAANATFMTGLTAAYVQSGGGTINNGGNAITVGQALLAPTGNGVSATGLTASGSGFIDTPIVTITGGGGSGATAVANIDSNGNLTGITITNAGTGYTSAPTFALVGGGIGNTGSLGGTATLVTNTSGGMTFNGTGTTTLSGVNTYTGATLINAGTLALASTGSLASTQITAASGSTFDVSAVSGYTVGSGVTLTNNGTVNGSFTVASGATLNGSGTFSGAVAVNGNLNPGNSPGTQTFASGLTLGAASVTTMEIAGSGGVAGTDFDFINVTGGTMTNDGSLTIVDFGGYDISAQTGTYNLFDFVANTGDFDVVTVDGTSLTYNVGTDDWSATAGDATYNFAEGTGVLSVTVVPEPTAALLGGLGMLGLLRRRRVA
jgi:fibronectin-binding autotransporter adhesin